MASALDTALLPARWRRTACGLAGLLGAGFIGLTAQVLRSGRDLAVNTALDDRLSRHLTGHGRLLEVARAFGSRNTLFVAITVFVLLGLVQLRGRVVLLTLLALPGAGALTEHLLKPWTSAHAPPNSHPGFPSGHATGAFAIACLAVLVLLPDTRRPTEGAARLLLRITVGAALSALAGATAVSAVALGSHNAASALGGALVGSCFMLVCALAVDQAMSLAQPAIAGSRPVQGDGSCRAAN